MDNNITVYIDEIKEYAEIFLEQEYACFDECKNIEDLLKQLNIVFCEWEDKIDKEKYDRQPIEYKVSGFANSLALIIAKYENDFLISDNNEIIKLLKHRHLGYGFYKKYNDTKEFLDNYPNYASILYGSMADYYKNYFGSFYDNELAINMLCKYYYYLDKHNSMFYDNLVSALCTHCKMAGEPGDIGFAFHGIEEIRNGFPKLSQDIVIKVIEKYSYHEVWNRPVYRKQIYTMIDSCTSEGNINKEQLKFFYIDGVMLIQQIYIIIYRIKEKETKLEYLNIDNESISENRIESFKLKNKNIYWSNYKINFSRELVDNDSKVIAKVELIKNENTKEYNIVVTGNDTKQIRLEYSYNDYTLNQYNALNTLKDIEKLFLPNDVNIDNNKFLFSNIWVDNYRNVRNVQLSFDNKFKISFANDSLDINNNDDNSIIPDSFWGENIYSVSAIVGKNGTGKTSIIQFLRDTFFDLLYKIDTNMIKITDGIIKEEVKNNEKYFVIFYIDENAYYITNYEKVNLLTQKVEAYRGKTLRRNREKSRIIYFSNMIDTDPTKDKPVNVYDKEILLKQALTFPSFIDYSENMSYIQKSIEYNKFYDNLNKITKDDKGKTKNENVYLNIDFWYKITFLSEYKNLNKIFGEKFIRRNLKCETYNSELNRQIKDILKKENSNLIEDIKQVSKEKLKSTIIKFENLSAGQYAKFSFLSKLYWCLDGYDKYHRQIEEIIGRNAFNINNTIMDDCTTIIFIDEGEAFYHPEWQQEYISNLIEFINTYAEGKNVKIQIVMTSNSPFIISDIPRENILFLPEEMESKEQTFAANLYDLCKSSLFLNSNNYGAIGDFATAKINEVEEILSEMLQRLEITDKETEKNIQNFENSNQNIKKVDIDKLKDCKFIIDMIGEKFIKRSLMKLYDQVYINMHINDKNADENQLEKLNELQKKFDTLNKEEQDTLIRYIINKRNQDE